MKSSFAPQRKHLRVAWRLPATIEIPAEKTEISAVVFNISTAGVLLYATHRLPKNSHVEVLLKMPEGYQPAELRQKGRVRRMGLEREGLVAIEFQDMNEAKMARMRELVMKRALDQITYLSQFPAFWDLSDLDLLALTSVCHEIRLSGGQRVAKFGDEADSVFLIKNGAVRLTAPSSETDGEPQEVEVARTGQVFGEASALLKLPHNLDVKAIEDTELLLIPSAALVYLRDYHPSLAVSLYEIFAAFMGRRLRRLTGRLFSPLAY